MITSELRSIIDRDVRGNYVLVTDLNCKKEKENYTYLTIIKCDNKDKITDELLKLATDQLGESIRIFDGSPTRFINDEGFELAFADFTGAVIEL